MLEEGNSNMVGNSASVPSEGGNVEYVDEAASDLVSPAVASVLGLCDLL